jgi:hypothetical protein
MSPFGVYPLLISIYNANKTPDLSGRSLVVGIGVKITKAAGNEFVGRIFHFESPRKILEGLSLYRFIKFSGENN